MATQTSSITFRSKKALSEGLGVSRTTVASWTARADFPERDAAGWSLHDVFAWVLTRQRKAPADDPALDGPASPALERYRDARARLAQLDVLERERTLVELEKLQTFMDRWSGLLRAAGSRLQGKFGKDAMAVLTDALDECEALVNKELAE